MHVAKTKALREENGFPLAKINSIQLSNKLSWNGLGLTKK